MVIIGVIDPGLGELAAEIGFGLVGRVQDTFPRSSRDLPDGASVDRWSVTLGGLGVIRVASRR